MPQSDEISSATYALALALGAGELLVNVQKSALPGEIGTDVLKARGDAVAQKYLNERLRREHPNDAILSEEAPDSGERLSARRVWIIDPLDGTREFSDGRDDWAVHVALWEDGDLVAGAVALPGIGSALSSADPARPVTRPSRIRLAVSRSRPPKIVDYLVEHLDLDLVPMGSAGFKTTAVVRGDADAYIHAGGQFEWDSAAPVAVARQAGLFASRIDGSPLKYNQIDPYLPDLLVCAPANAEHLLAAMNSYTKDARD
ncbi:MAG: 3(2),5-bisphosphate nucleotidase CysQ [Microbacteriaceae bacterium]|nr:3(2),5-bisphosphate nucleotidase CysQ [Microbacteriaceae bacterium]